MKIEDLLNLQLDEIPDLDDKYQECRFFMNSAQETIDLNEYRWFFSAFLSAAKSCIDIKAMQLYEFTGRNTGENTHFDYRIRKGRVCTSMKSEVLKRMVVIRNVNSHECPAVVRLILEGSRREVCIGSEFINANEFMADILNALEDVREI